MCLSKWKGRLLLLLLLRLICNFFLCLQSSVRGFTVVFGVFIVPDVDITSVRLEDTDEEIAKSWASWSHEVSAQ